MFTIESCVITGMFNITFCNYFSSIKQFWRLIDPFVHYFPSYPSNNINNGGKFPGQSRNPYGLGVCKKNCEWLWFRIPMNLKRGLQGRCVNSDSRERSQGRTMVFLFWNLSSIGVRRSRNTRWPIDTRARGRHVRVPFTREAVPIYRGLQKACSHFEHHYHVWTIQAPTG